MLPVNRISGKPEANPRPMSPPEIGRVRLARYLRDMAKQGASIPDVVKLLHDEPSDSNWCPGMTA